MRIVEDKVILETETIFYENHCLWFTEMTSGDFYCYDLQKEEAALICENPEKRTQSRLYGDIVKQGDFFYLIPFWAERMYKISTFDHSVTAIDLNLEGYAGTFQYGAVSSSLSAHVYQEKIYIIPVQAPIVIEYDCLSGEIVYFESWEQEDCIKNVDELAVCRKTLLADHKIYIPYCKGNYVAIFDLKTKKTDLCMVGSEKCSYAAMCLAENEFWLAPRKSGPLVCWNSTENVVREYKEFKADDSGFHDILAVGRELILLPSESGTVLKMDMATGDMQELACDDAEVGGMSCCRDHECVYLFSQQSGKLYLYHSAVQTVEKRYILAPGDVADQFKKEQSFLYRAIHGEKNLNAELFCEDYREAVNDFLHYVDQKKEEGGQKDQPDENGRRIWQEQTRISWR